MKKRVLFITVLPIWSLGNNSGGKALFSTVNYYIENGYDVSIMTDKKVDMLGLNPKNVYYINAEFFSSKMNIKKIGLLFKFLYVQYFKRRCCKIFKSFKNKNCLIYAYEVQAVMAGKKIAKKYKLPLITRFQGTIMSQYKNSLINKIRYYPHIQALSTKSNLVIMTNDGTQGNIVLNNCNNFSPRLFIRNGVNILDKKTDVLRKNNDLLKQLNLQDKIILLTVSRLEKWKKVERAINTLYELNDSKYHLVIVGDGAEMNNLKLLVKNLNLDNQVTFTGAIPNNDVYQYMSITNLFLSFYDLSNVGNPLLEALCLGKAIITYNVGDTNQIIDGKNGILLDNIDPKFIAQTIKNLSSDDIKKYEKKALEYANTNLYSWKKRMMIEGEKVEALYNEFFD